MKKPILQQPCLLALMVVVPCCFFAEGSALVSSDAARDNFIPLGGRPVLDLTLSHLCLGCHEWMS
jgi:hypothetical protein